MPDYRIYEIGQHGHVVRLLIELTLPSDVISVSGVNGAISGSSLLGCSLIFLAVF
jgi:hypothetical protein